MRAPKTTADLIVIGAGPKGVAIAVKLHVLNALGYGPLRAILVERKEVASSWTGRHGFTTGDETLGTRPEKDLGFPYQSGAWFSSTDSRIDEAMLRFSWQSHLVCLGEYRRWVDMGVPAPTHREMARYLAWALERATNGVELRLAAVSRVELDDRGWSVECEGPNGLCQSLRATRGLVLTGPGTPSVLPHASEVAHRILYPSMTKEALEAVYVRRGGRVCIIGCGESAASMALWMIRRHGSELDLTFVAPTLPYSRSESFLDNAVYSDSRLLDWSHLTEGQRMEFVRRTDRGVMSPVALAQLARHRKLSFVVGRVREIQLDRTGLVKAIVDQPDEFIRQEFDAVAVCVGSSPISGLTRLLGSSRGEIERRLACSLGDEYAVTRLLDSALALRGLNPRLHLPSMAWLLHGPGFANLSCLGALSDCVLSAYLSPQRALKRRGELAVS
jgi:mycobactin lysine-N-oxygenase